MNYLLLMMSILMEAAKTLMLTGFSKTSLVTDADIYKFNVFMYLGCLAVAGVSGVGSISLFSVVTAFLFALVTIGAQIFFLIALRYGPLSFTSFLQGISLVIPVVAGVLFMGDGITLHQLLAFPVLFVALALVFNLSKETLTWKWTLFALLSMLCMGGVGIVQTVHQASEHRGELSGFLSVSFVFAILLNLLLWKCSAKKDQKTFPVNGRALMLSLTSGIFMGVVNIVDLYLAGVMPKAVFFPIVNGGLTVMTLLGSVVFFREKLNAKQWMGILICTAALCVLGV